MKGKITNIIVFICLVSLFLAFLNTAVFVPFIKYLQSI